MSERFKITSVYIMICLIWGTTWFAIKAGLDSFPPFFSASMRFAVASVVFALIIYIRKYPVPMSKTSIKFYLFMGICSYVIPFGMIYWAEQVIPSGLASVIFTIYPFAVIIFSRMMIRGFEIAPYKIFGMFVGLGGIVLIFAGTFKLELSKQLIGMTAAVLNAVIQAFVLVTIKKRGKDLHPVTMNFLPMVIGSIGLFIIALFTENIHASKFTGVGIFTVFYLGVLGSVVTFTSYYWLLNKINILLLAVVSFITPVVALYTGWLLGNEKLDSHQMIGSIVALAGVLFASLPEPRLLRKRLRKV